MMRPRLCARYIACLNWISRVSNVDLGMEEPLECGTRSGYRSPKAPPSPIFLSSFMLFLRCISCQSEFPASSQIYTCLSCDGLLDVVYDLNRFRGGELIRLWDGRRAS